ncbi:MAG: lamin tail domain-containing protein [Saprospiraceae bacterium]|nr:lamin tail domain-containing protein [Saprospiraceae bacterium]
MKKTLWTLLFLGSFLASASAQVVITEIMYNPPESGTDSLEYVELFNKSNSPLDVSGWNFTQGFEFVFPASSTINPNSYIVIAKSASAFESVFGFQPYGIWVINGALTNNPGEDIELRDAAGNVIDYVDYMNAAPWPIGANGNGASLVLCDVNADNALASSWQDASTSTGVTINGKEILANPGAASNCSSAINAKPDNFFVPQGATSFLVVTGNDVVPSPPILSMMITGNPANGTALVNPDNTVSYTPNAGFCGPDAFVYQICDAGGCDTALVSLNVQCFTPLSIAAISNENADGVADSLNVSCQLVGTVYGVNTRASLSGIQFTLIDDDNTAGINVFSPQQSFGYTVTEGDVIAINGVIGQFNGLIQISPINISVQSQNAPLAQPETVVAPSEATESRLIKIGNLHLVDAAEWTNGVGPGFSARAVSDDHPLDTVLIRVDNDVTLFNEPAPTGPFDLIGIGGQFDSNNPYTSGYQIAPRYTADLLPLVGVKNADFSAQVKLSPNPAGDFVQIQTDIRFDRIQLFSTTGQLLFSQNNPEQTSRLDLGKLAAGTYFVQFVKEGAVWTARVVKQ